MIRILIIDDEPLARQGLRNMLRHETDVEIIGECGDGLSAVQQIEALQPDLVFLDIQMPVLDGFEVVKKLGIERMPMFIFVTAYDEFALEAFRVHALDYLLKPVKAAEFRAAFLRAKKQLSIQQTGVNKNLQALLATLNNQSPYLERFVIKSRQKMHIVKVVDVDWLEAQGDYVQLHCGQKRHLLREKISMLEKQLDPAIFCRIHRSTIIKLDQIAELEPLTNGDYEIKLATGKRLTLSRTYRENFFKRLRG